MKNIINTENVGFLIVGQTILTERSRSIAIGERKENNGVSYVTWEYSDTSDFYWGHYFTNKKEAMDDYLKRIQSYNAEESTEKNTKPQ